MPRKFTYFWYYKYLISVCAEASFYPFTETYKENMAAIINLFMEAGLHTWLPKGMAAV
jgi:hypothetical protein